MSANALVPTERQVQRSILDLIARKYPRTKAYHVPNGANLSVAERVRMKGDGRRKGIPDLFCIWPGGDGWLEIKRPGYSPSDVSPEQRDFIEAVRANGGNASLVSSVDSADATLTLWGAM